MLISTYDYHPPGDLGGHKEGSTLELVGYEVQDAIEGPQQLPART